ncbi:hypothetical protein PanWU01x14_173280 [Parasponia andersonii]|uniref:DUF7054 domain-containing protein n=1 Tax=Parasponia andersonii TaxID=3476 RepID=A0A2P5C8N9_PARAD|nr:hypothetical protein PanWU01x14_173280 [Parasponia andersonii]
MIPRSSIHRRQFSGRAAHPSSERPLLTFPPERSSVGLVRRPGGILSVPAGKLAPPARANGGGPRRLTKLLLNVTIERSLGPVQVVMSSENSVGDLVKAAVELYVGEKRRPLLLETDPHRFELHYSQFSLESLRRDEKLINLGSRNFFLCSKRVSSTVKCCCYEEANSLLPLTKLMDLLL